MSQINVNNDEEQQGIDTPPENEDTLEQLWADLKLTSSSVPRHAISLLGAEWQLSRTSLLLALVAILIFSGMVIIAWLFISISLGYGLFLAGIPVYAIGLILIGVQLICCWAAWKASGYFYRHVGFSQSMELLKAITG